MSPTNTFTITLTYTPTNTPTITNTHTPTISPTSTFTITPTISPTNTFTVTVTFTPTNTYTITNTRTPSFTPTNTFTATVTPTVTLTHTPTSPSTPTFTFTPTVTNTITNTRTFTNTPTFTNTFTPSYTQTNTPTVTWTPTFTNTPTVTNSPTPTQTPTATFTPTPDVEIAKLESESVGHSNDIVTYTLVVSPAFGQANSVVVTDALPNYLTFEGFGPVPASVNNPSFLNNTLTWTLVVMPATPVTLTFQAQLATFVPQGTVITNTAQLTYTGLSSPKRASVSMTMATSYTVHIGVYNEAGELITSYPAMELSQEITNFSILASPTITTLNGVVYIEVNGQELESWNGMNQSGTPVQNGSYYVKVDNTDPFGITNTVSQVVTVNRHLAKVQVNIFNEAGEIIRHLTSYVDDAGTFSIDNVNLSTAVLQPTSDTTPVPGNANYVTINLGNGQSLSWDGKDDQGSIVTNGHYNVEIHYEDGTGGDQVVTRGLLVETTGQTHPNDVVYAKPNVLNGRSGYQTALRVDSNDAYTLRIKIYDIAGELIRNVPVVPDGVNNEMQADFSSQASGMYFAMVELINGQGGVAKRQALKIVVVR